MIGHICITFTTTILSLHTYDYYSSNSSTSKHTHLTGVITSFCRQSTHMRGLVTASLVRSAIDVSVFVQTAWTCASAVLCMRFLASFLCFRCLNVTTLFNTDVKKYVFVPSRLSAALLPFCAIAVEIYLPSPRAPGISVYIFSCNCKV